MGTQVSFKDNSSFCFLYILNIHDSFILTETFYLCGYILSSLFFVLM